MKSAQAAKSSFWAESPSGIDEPSQLNVRKMERNVVGWDFAWKGEGERKRRRTFRIRLFGFSTYSIANVCQRYTTRCAAQEVVEVGTYAGA